MPTLKEMLIGVVSRWFKVHLINLSITLLGESVFFRVWTLLDYPLFMDDHSVQVDSSNQNQ